MYTVIRLGLSSVVPRQVQATRKSTITGLRTDLTTYLMTRLAETRFKPTPPHLILYSTRQPQVQILDKLRNLPDEDDLWPPDLPELP